MMYTLVLMCISQHTKFEMPTFTNCKDMIVAKLKNGSRDPDHANYGVVRHPKVST